MADNLNSDGAGRARSWPDVRWDRKLREAMLQPAIRADMPETASGVQGAGNTDGPGIGNRMVLSDVNVERGHSGRILNLLKWPLSRFRDYMNGPIDGRIDAASVNAHNAAIDGIERMVALERQIELDSTRIASLEHLVAGQSANLDRLQVVLDKLQDTYSQTLARTHDDLIRLRTDVGYLHGKSDEAMLKGRPVIHRDGAYAVPLADGYIFIPEEEETLLLMYTGAGSDGLEPGVRRIMQAVVEPGDHVVDVGSSVGLHTLALARAAGAGGRVDAFEAEPRLAPNLQRMLDVNGLSQVNLHAFAVGAEDGSTSFHVARTIGHSSLYSLGAEDLVREEVEVEVRALDSVIGSTESVDFMKIDVEGAELDVIRGAKRVLENSPQCSIIAECGPSHLRRIGVSTADWFEEFSVHGFKPFAITEPFGRLNGLTVDWVEAQESVNVLFLKPQGAAHGKLLDDLDLLDEAD